jgi:putative FmdB family regulatory protein
LEVIVPVYAYRCQDCERKFAIRMPYEEYGTRAVQCPKCESQKVSRLINRVRMLRSEESRLDNLADPASLAGLEDDPKALGRMMRQMSGEMGEELGPEFDEVVDRLEAGQSPEDIESALPDLGGGGDDYMPDF